MLGFVCRAVLTVSLACGTAVLGPAVGASPIQSARAGGGIDPAANLALTTQARGFTCAVIWPGLRPWYRCEFGDATLTISADATDGALFIARGIDPQAGDQLAADLQRVVCLGSASCYTNRVTLANGDRNVRFTR